MQLLTLFVGFLLTTVAGGFLGTWFQQRAWDHQRRSQLAAEELSRASAACEAVTRLMDRRLYRMLRLFYLVRVPLSNSEDSTEVDAKLADYDEVLYEWNEQLNLNLALVGVHFGEAARDWLGGVIS